MENNRISHNDARVNNAFRFGLQPVVPGIVFDVGSSSGSGNARDVRKWRLDDVAETELLPLRAFLIRKRGHGYHAAMPGTRHGTARRPTP
jgi:hypothetical protein